MAIEPRPRLTIIGTPEQIQTLKEIVAEWISEGFTTPPYTPEQYDVFEALGIFGNSQYDVGRP